MTLDERIRSEFNDVIAGAPCPLCGHERKPVPLIRVAREIGVSIATLERFRKGTNVSARTLSRVDEWLAVLRP